LKGLDQEVAPEAGALGEVAEFMREHAGELRQREAGRQWQADGEIEMAEEESTPSPHAGGGWAGPYSRATVLVD
jgi:hypothetical protein